MRSWASRRAAARPSSIAALAQGRRAGRAHRRSCRATPSRRSAPCASIPIEVRRRARGVTGSTRLKAGHGAEARAQHALDDHDGAPRQDLRQPDGRPLADERRSCGSGPPASSATSPASAASDGRRGVARRRRSTSSRRCSSPGSGSPPRRRPPGSTRAGGRLRAPRRRPTEGGEPMKVLGMISGTSHDGIDAARRRLPARRRHAPRRLARRRYDAVRPGAAGPACARSCRPPRRRSPRCASSTR